MQEQPLAHEPVLLPPDLDLSRFTPAQLDELARRLAQVRHAIPVETLSVQRWRHRFLDLMIVCCAVLVPWIVVLAATTPARYTVRHWTLTWTGYDVLELAGLVVTAWAAWRRRRPLAVVAATITATLLVADAWFDLLTSVGTDGLVISAVDAAVVELPLAALLFFVAARLLRRTVRVVRYLAGAPGDDRRVFPPGKAETDTAVPHEGAPGG